MFKQKKIRFFFLGICFLLFSLGYLGCKDDGQEINPTSIFDPNSILSPTISNLAVSGDKISRSKGGILKLSCQWTSPFLVSSSTTSIAFVRSLNDPVASPTGIISSTTASVSKQLVFHQAFHALPSILAQAASPPGTASPTGLASPTGVASPTTVASTTPQASTTVVVASSTASSTTFFEKFQNPLVIPSGIGSTGQKGSWQVEIPFPSNVVYDAPLGKQQLLIWMIMNGKTTNTLAFEIEFIQ